MLGRRSKTLGPVASNPDDIAAALAKAVAEGDIVNFRQIFGGLSPARPETVESLAEPKYGYLLPDSTQRQAPAYQEALRLVRAPEMWAYIEEELAARRPARLPSGLLLPLADNAVAQAKYSSAAQAYELMRLRRDVQEKFYAGAKDALGRGAVDEAVTGYLVGVGLSYDYAAFPEPLPLVQNFPRRALVLHAEAPRRPEEVLPFQPPEQFLQIGIEYLLGEADHADEVLTAPLATRVAFFAELVRRRDTRWDDFVKRFGEAALLEQRWNEKLREMMRGGQDLGGLQADLAEQLGEDPRRVPEMLLGRAIPNGEWWQYLKELAYEHPPAALFVSRRMLGRVEIITPRLRLDNPVLGPLGLEATAQQLAPPPAPASTAQ